MGNLTEFIRLQDAADLGESAIHKIANYIYDIATASEWPRNPRARRRGVDDCRDRASNERQHGSYYERECNTSHLKNGHATEPAPPLLSAQRS